MVVGAALGDAGGCVDYAVEEEQSIKGTDMNASQPRVLIALATYNERDNLAPLVEAIRATVPTADVLILDDNSPDGTGAAADALALQDAKVHVIHRAGKLGLGTAILTIMRFAMEKNYDL